MLHALRSGYRHIDTAEIYRNEEDCGAAIADFLAEAAGAVRREDLWITTKFFPRSGSGRAAVHEALRESLRKLRLQYVDLYLIHAPHTRERLEQYHALEALREEGMCRSIGVSNYKAADLQGVDWGGVKPVVNQCHLSVGQHDDDTIAYCIKEGITYEGFGTMRSCCKLPLDCGSPLSPF